MYIVTSFVFFMVGGLLALLMRAELARPGLQDSESSPHLAIGTPSTDPNDDQGT